MNPRKLAKDLAHAVMGDYSLYVIYRAPEVPLPVATPPGLTLEVLDRPGDVAQAPDPDVARVHEDALPYPDIHAFVAREGGAIVGCSFVWGPGVYRQRRAFMTLAEGEAKLIQITVAKAMRGRGVAPALISFTHERLLDLGYRRAFARIWHSNTPSVRAFERAGWHRDRFVAEVGKSPWGPRRQLVVPLGRGPALPSLRTYKLDPPG